MSNGEKQAVVEGYKHLAIPVYRIVLFFSIQLSLRVQRWTIYMIDPKLRYMTKVYSCKPVEGVCESMKGGKSGN